ncbi:MAG: hypothetical protein ACSHYF_07490 [Verrucomicrobiaceae bacterium]
MKAILFIAVIALIWGGGQSLYTSITNTKASTFTIQEYIADKPDAKWLELTDCHLDLTEAAYSSGRFDTSIDEVFIPVTTTDGGNGGQPVHILLATKDKETIALLEKMAAVESEEDAFKLLIENADQFFPKKDVSGLVRFGLDMKDKEVRKLRNLNPNLTKDFVMIDDGAKPNWAGAFLLPAGLGLGWFLYWPKKSKAALPPELPSTGATPPQMPDAPASATEDPAVTKFHCPGCNQKFSVPSDQSGQQIDCPQCQSSMLVP